MKKKEMIAALERIAALSTIKPVKPDITAGRITYDDAYYEGEEYGYSLGLFSAAEIARKALSSRTDSD